MCQAGRPWGEGEFMHQLKVCGSAYEEVGSVRRTFQNIHNSCVAVCGVVCLRALE